jgi:hypothetical protein
VAERRGDLLGLVEGADGVLQVGVVGEGEHRDCPLSALTKDERDQLAALLRTLLVGFEHEHAGHPSGFSVAPAPVARHDRGVDRTPPLRLRLRPLRGEQARDVALAAEA